MRRDVVGHRGTVLKRFAIWVGVLAVAVAAGFGLGALTYVPPNPEMNAATNNSIDQSTPSPSPEARPRLRVIPDLVGTQRAMAEKRLGDLNILFLVNPVGGKDDDRVMSQNPAAGTPVAKAKHVLVSVRCRPRPCPPPPPGKQMYDPCACLWR